MHRVLQVLLVAVLCLGGTRLAAQKPEKADTILNEAKLKSVSQHKPIFLFFDASWCEACHQFDVCIASPEVAAIFDKYFVIARVTFGEGSAGHPEWDNSGSDTLLLKYGGVANGIANLPFIAILDEKARLIANSNHAGKDNAGAAKPAFPTEPEDVLAFLSMLQKAAPSITDSERQTIKEGLRKAATN